MASRRWEIRSFTDGQHFKVVHTDGGDADDTEQVHDCVDGRWVERPGGIAVSIHGEVFDSGSGTGDDVCPVCAGRNTP